MSEDAPEESTTIRKVYVLPRELVERISAFQKAKRLPSEVEAVRRLLDEALKSRDTADTILLRFVTKLREDGMVSSVARDLLIGHPLISAVSFPSAEEIVMTIKGFGNFSITDDGKVYSDPSGRGVWQEYDDYDPPPF